MSASAYSRPHTWPRKPGHVFEWNQTSEAIYKRCMALAYEAHVNYCKGKIWSIAKIGYPADICYEAARWTDIWDAYSRGWLTEEEIKFCTMNGIAYDWMVTAPTAEAMKAIRFQRLQKQYAEVQPA